MAACEQTFTPTTLKPILTLLGTASVIAFLTRSCHPSQRPSAPPQAAVTAQQPVQREIVEWDEYPGRLEPVEMVEVRARVNGYLESVHFKDGDIVKKGELLFVIDP